LASPPLVVAYALAGTVDIDLNEDSFVKDKEGNDVYLEDLWPSTAEIQNVIDEVVTPENIRSQYDNLFESNEHSNAIETSNEPLYEWQEDSTYIQNPPFIEGLTPENDEIKPLNNFKVLGYFGDSITADQISTAGAIAMD